MGMGAELLDGESREWAAGDAEHWIGVYTELVAFCHAALAATDAGDGLLIRRRLHQFEARLAFWRRGRESLEITKA
jgi:hypothetical protein